MATTTIEKIGAQAINEEQLLILFGPTATKDLAEYSILQTMPNEPIELKVGSTLLFGDQKYQVTKLGPVVNQNLNSLSHATVLFQAGTEEVANGIYVSPAELPELKVGMKITFQ